MAKQVTHWHTYKITLKSGSYQGSAKEIKARVRKLVRFALREASAKTTRLIETIVPMKTGLLRERIHARIADITQEMFLNRSRYKIFWDGLDPYYGRYVETMPARLGRQPNWTTPGTKAPFSKELRDKYMAVFNDQFNKALREYGMKGKLPKRYIE